MKKTAGFEIKALKPEIDTETVRLGKVSYWGIVVVSIMVALVVVIQFVR